MVTPDEEPDQYDKDPRIPCKYGASCYQKNPVHQQKYKHPPKKRSAREDETGEGPSSKKRKEAESDTVKISNAISESEDSAQEDSKDSVESDENVKQESESNAEVEDKDNEAPIQRTPVSFNEKEFIKQKFLLDMPKDFYLFWDFCKGLKSSDPSKAFSSVGLTLVGPYDVLAGKFSNVIDKSSEDYLIHWRYYYDPPEFQTVLKADDSAGYHIGYFRDHPLEEPVFLASNYGTKDGEFTCVGDNIFAAIATFLEQAVKSSNPFKKMEITKLLSSVKLKSEALSLNISNKSSTIKERNKKILTRTFNKIGLVVPYNRKTQLGYRHLCCSDEELRKLLDRLAKASEQQKSKVMSELQAVFTATNIAIDECDFGTGIELGWDILAHGVEGLNPTIERYLTTGYQLLQWPEFVKIATAHMKSRRKGTNLSIL